MRTAESLIVDHFVRNVKQTWSRAYCSASQTCVTIASASLGKGLGAPDFLRQDF